MHIKYSNHRSLNKKINHKYDAEIPYLPIDIMGIEIWAVCSFSRHRMFTEDVPLMR